MVSDNSRYDWVDMAKGLSIFLVVIMYCAASVGEDTGQTGFLHWSMAFAMPFRMPEFFLISGLFLSRVINRPWRDYADRRVVHYFYFYALWALIHILFKVGLVGRDPVGAVSYLGWAVVQPYGVLWFIYMLGAFGLASKALRHLRVPHWAVLIAGAALQMATIQTGSYLVDQFCAYFVYFYAGYVLAPAIFRLADWASNNVVPALFGLALWAVVNAVLVFSPGFRLDPVHIEMGWGALPGVHLAAALAGSLAICVTSALLVRVPFMDWLRWLGTKSLVVYVAFVLPMGIARTILLAVGINEPNLLSLIVMAVAIISPLILWWMVEKTGFRKFLFERPAWAHLPGTRHRKAATSPAE